MQGRAMSGPAWLEEASKHIGTREIPGPKHESKIIGWFKAIHAAWFVADEVPWCAAFVGGCLEAVGIRSSRSAAAKSYLTWGVPLSAPVVGCIVVFLREGGGHVGFVVGKDAKGRLMVLGGNQGDAVTIAPFERARAVGFRWPAAVPLGIDSLPTVISEAASSTNEA
jgi:uncharacterized protein (TIGR02594 family)